MRRLAHTDQRASAMVMALGFMAVVLIIALGVHILVGDQLAASGALYQRVSAQYLAEGGIARALGWFNSQGYQLPPASSLTATVPVKLSGNGTAVVLPSNHPDSYVDTLGQARTGIVSNYTDVLTAQPAAGGSYGVVATLIAMQPEVWEVVATARLGSVQRQVGALLYRQYDSLFPDALFGRRFATLNGNAYTDSYDSSQGPYGGANRSQSGNVHSNGNITLNGNATVKGDAVPGPNMAVSMNGNAAVTGSTDAAETPRVLPPVTLPSAAMLLGALQLSGNNTRTLTAGTYVATSMSITGNGKLIIDSSGGPVNLFVTGSISVAGNGIANLSGVPQNFALTQAGGADVSFSGNANFIGTVYAPDSALSVSGNGDLYGAFCGDAITINGNGGIHFDKLQSRLPGPPGLLKLVSQWAVLS